MTAATRTEGEVDPRAVIFDLDGTLIDTYETHGRMCLEVPL